METHFQNRIIAKQLQQKQIKRRRLEFYINLLTVSDTFRNFKKKSHEFEETISRAISLTRA